LLWRYCVLSSVSSYGLQNPLACAYAMSLGSTPTLATAPHASYKHQTEELTYPVCLIRIRHTVGSEGRRTNMNARCVGARLALCFIISVLLVSSLAAQNVSAGRRNPAQIALLEWYEINQTTSFGSKCDGIGWGIISGLAFDGTNIWMSGVTDTCGNGGVHKVRASDGLIVQCDGISIMYDIGRLAYDGANMWITDARIGVHKVRASDCTDLGYFPVGGNDTSAVAFDGASIWVVGTTTNTLTKLRASDGSIQLGWLDGLGGSSLAFDGTNIWVVTASQTFKVRTSDGQVVGKFPVGGSAIAFDGTNMWITGGQTLKLRSSDGAVLGTFPAPGNGIAL